MSIDWKGELKKMDETLIDRLLNLAAVAEKSDYWTDEQRLMPAEGVADLLYEAADTIERFQDQNPVTRDV